MKASLVCGILSALLVGTLSVEPTKQPYKPWGQVYKPYVSPYNWTVITRPGDPKPSIPLNKPIDYSFVTRPPLLPTTTTQTPRPFYSQQPIKPLELSRPIGEIKPSVNKPLVPSQPWAGVTRPPVVASQPSQPWAEVTRPPVQPSQPWGQVGQQPVQQPQPSLPLGQGSQQQVPVPSQPWGQVGQQVQQPQPSQPWGQGSQASVQQPSQPWGEVNKPVELPQQKPIEELKPYGEQKPFEQPKPYGEEPKPYIEQRQPFESSKPLEPQQPLGEQPIKPIQQLPSSVEPSQPVQQLPSYVDPSKPVQQLPSYDPSKPVQQLPSYDPSKPVQQLPSYDPSKPVQQQQPSYIEPSKPLEQQPSYVQPFNKPIEEPLNPIEQKPLEQSRPGGQVNQPIVPVVQNSSLEQPKPWGAVSIPLEQNKTLEQYTTTELPKPYGEVSQLPVQSSQLPVQPVPSKPWTVINKPVLEPQPLSLGFQKPEYSTLPQSTLYVAPTTPIPYAPYSSEYQPYWYVSPFQGVQCNHQINEHTLLAYRHAVYNMSTPLYKRAAALTEGHFVFSPYTIWLTMAAMAEGASGRAQQELFKFLSLPQDNCLRQTYYKIATNREHAGNDIVLARNRLFVADSSIHVNKQWEDYVESHTELKTVSVPYKQNPAAEIEALKKVFKAHLPNINLSGNSLLLESLDYHGLWTSAFNDAVVQEGPFYNSFGQQIGVVEYMKTVKLANIGVIASMNLKVIDLPVGKDGRYRMYFAIPLSASENYVRNFDLIENSFIIEAAASLKPSLEPVEIVIPKMAMTTELDVRQLFEDVGIKSLWIDPQATRNISEPAALPSAFVQRVTVTIDDGGLRPAIQEYHNYVPPLHHAQAYSKPVSYPNLPGPWSHDQHKPVEAHFIANKPFMFGLFDAKTLTGCFTASFSKIQP